MKNFNIILIKPNNLKTFNPYSSEFDNEISNYIEIKTVDDYSFIENLITHLKLSNNNEKEKEKNEYDYTGDTDICYETEKYVYEICHVDKLENQIESRGDNVLSSQLTLLHKTIDGPSILYGYKINKKGVAENININKDTIKEILINKFFHKGIYIHTSGNMCEFTYHNDLNVFNEQNQIEELLPRLQEIGNLIKTGLYYDYSIYKYNLVIIFSNEYKNSDINKILTVFLNNKIKDKNIPAKGNFIILNKVAKNDYTNITINEFKKIVYCYKDKDLKSEDTKIEKIDNLYVIKNRFVILNNRFKKYKKKLEDFNDFINKTFNEFILDNNIFNKYILDEIKNKNNEKQKIQEQLGDILKENKLDISQELDININLENK